MKAEAIPIQEFLEQIEARGIRLRVEGEVVKVGWPEQKPDPEIRQILVERKPEILAALSHSIDRLTDAEREAYREYIQIMVSPKFNLPMEQAEREAMHLVMRAKPALQARQAAEDYRRFGYVKIFSAVLGRSVYMARNEQAAKRVPDKSIPVFLESDVEAAKGLSQEEIKVLLEARILLGGPITVEDSTEPPAPKKMDGKQIARNFYRKEKE